jgi:hypothetical protein
MPHWITGFCDRSGSFGLTMYQSKGKWYFKVVFEVLLDIKDVALLETLKEFFGVGHIYLQKTTAVYRVASLDELMAIINHFNAYPLISTKRVVFSLWSKVVDFIRTSKHKLPDTFNYIYSVYAALGRGPSTAAKQAFPSLTPISLPSYTVPVKLEDLNPWWVSGYLTLYCSFGLKIEAAGGWDKDIYNKFRHTFKVSFDNASLSLAHLIADFIGIPYYVRSDGERVDVMAQSSQEVNNVVSFLDDYPLQSYKNAQYDIWRTYVQSITIDRESDIQRRLKHQPIDRFDYYSKLIDQFYAKRR